MLTPRLPGEQIARDDPAAIEAFGAAGGALVAAPARIPPRPHPTLPGYGGLARLHPRLPDPFGLRPADLGLPETPETDELFGGWRGRAGAGG